jgi:tetratricopeptide (TPR) repeat protein
MHRHFFTFVLAAGLFGPAVGWRALAADGLLPESFWSDRQFVAGFIGSYGINSATEPSLTADEQQFLLELAAIIPTNQPLAMARIETGIQTGTATVAPAELPLEEAERSRRRRDEPKAREVKLTNLARLHYTLGNLQVQEGQTDAAIQSYRAAIGLFPNYLNAQKNLGIVLVRGGNLSEARGPLLRAVELGAVDGNLYGLLGTCYMSERNFRSAELAYNQAMLLAPDRKEWRLGAARALFSMSRYEEAAGLFAELIENEPGNADYWTFQANCFIALNQPLKAAYNYEVVRELGAAKPATLNALADIYLSRNLPEVALEAYLAALESDPLAGASTAIRSAEVLAARRAVIPAGTLLKRVTELAGNDLDATHRARMLRIESKLALAGGEDARAAAIMEELLEQDADDGEIIILLARYYGRIENIAKAEVLFDRAARLPGFEAEAHLRRAQMLAGPKLQRFDRAIEHLKRAQEIEPKENVQRYLEALERRARAARG